MTDNQVSLWMDGRVHEGWTSVAVDLNLDHLSGSFSLTLSDQYLRDGQLLRQPITEGGASTIKIDGETVITGWVDKVTPSFSGEMHQVSVTGRDRAGDLLDCSAGMAEYLDQPMAAILTALCRPFGVGVVVQTDTGLPFQRFAVNAGDTVGECIERMCRQRGVMVWSDGLGSLVIGRGAVGRPVASLARGVNLLDASAEGDFTKRFSEIIVKASREGTDGMAAADVAQIEARIKDPSVKRHRPKIIVPETHGEPVSLRERADWEYRVEVGRSRKVTAKVQGWRHGAGLWRPGQTVSFADDWLGISGNWLVANTALAKDGGGTTARLTLYPPGAFDRLAEAGKEW
jgi:prophage tail gpP-like protein